MYRRTVSLDPIRFRRPAAPEPLAHKGKINKGALMRRAISTARMLRAGGKSWSWKMSMGLRAAWDTAKREAGYQRADLRIAASYRSADAPAPALPARRPRLSGARPRVFLSGSRAFSHGW